MLLSMLIVVSCGVMDGMFLVKWGCDFLGYCL